MELPGVNMMNPVPVVLNAQRPGRYRPRHASDFHNHQHLYVHDGNGLLLPGANLGGGGLHRSNSAAGPRPASIIINNSQYDDYSPERSSHRRSHSHHYDSDSWDERSHRSHSHERHRPRSRSGHHRRRRSPSQTPSPDPEIERRLHRLAELERKEEEDAARQKFEEERIIEEAKKERKKKEEEALKKRAVEEYNVKKLEEELKKKKEKEEADKAFKERVRLEFGAAGYDEASIEKILEKEGKGKGHGQKKIMDLTRPTYIKVHRKHLSPDTLDTYDLPWEWDDLNSNYIIIKRWIPERDQEILFDHTRRMREGKLLMDSTIEMKKERDNLVLVEKKKDNLLLVRKKSLGRKRSTSRGWMFS